MQKNAGFLSRIFKSIKVDNQSFKMIVIDIIIDKAYAWLQSHFSYLQPIRVVR